LSTGLVDIFLLPIIIEAVLKAMNEGLSQNDLDNLFGDIMAETKKPIKVKEVNNIETLEGKDILSQDQIDEILRAFQND
jgi:hypothetical protein